MLRDVAQQHRVREAEADPADSEHGQRDRHDRRLPRPRNALEDECERERAQEACKRPLRAAGGRPKESRKSAEVAREHDRPQRPRHPVQLVQPDDGGRRREREHPPAAEVDEPEHDRDACGRDEDPRPDARSSAAEPPSPARILGHASPQVVLAEVGPRACRRRRARSRRAARAGSWRSAARRTSGSRGPGRACRERRGRRRARPRLPPRARARLRSCAAPPRRAQRARRSRTRSRAEAGPGPRSRARARPCARAAPPAPGRAGR